MDHDSGLPPGSPSELPPTEGAIARFFQFRDHGTTLNTEILAGVTTFMTMAYILVVNPAILSKAMFLNEAGDLFGELTIATAVAAAIATLIMGLAANYPFALAPGMGLNAYFAFSVVLGLGMPWPVALAAVLVEGIIFILLSLSNVRGKIVTAIPSGLKHASAAGIGMFLAYIALSGNPETGGAGIIVANEATTTGLSALNQPPTILALVGLVITSVLVVRRIKGALLWGILATAILGWIVGAAAPPASLIALPQFPVDLIFQAFNGLAQIPQVGGLEFAAVVFVFLFVDLFDTVGTLAGVAVKTGYINERGELPKAKAAFFADAIGTTVGAIVGTSTVTTYIESAAGVSEGGRTGFTAVVTAGLFLVSVLLVPLFVAIPGFATAPTLIIVGVLMAGSLRQIRWDDPAESIPAFLTVIIMPLSYSIAEGLAAGFITYPLLKAAQGKAREVTPALWILAVVFVIRFVWRAIAGG
jgi:AGZA family xanthine/uracil permease-like MFS transporter